MNQNMELQMRIKFLDVAKGLSILLVVLGHSHLLGSITEDPVNAALGTFRVPFFFFLSGVLFSYHKPLRTYVLYKFDVLVKPFFAVLFLSLILPTSTSLSLSSQILAIFYGSGAMLDEAWVPLWFLPHLWLVFVFATLLLKWVNYDKLRHTTKGALLLLLLVMGTTWFAFFWKLDLTRLGITSPLPGLPFSADLVFFTAFFFILGYSLRQAVAAFRPNYVVAGLCALTIYIAAYHLGTLVDLNNRLLVNSIPAVLSALCGIYGGLTLAMALSQIPYVAPIFTYLGRYSLFILLFHTPVYHLVLALIFGEPRPVGVVTSIILCLLISLGLGVIISGSSVLSLFFRPFRANQLLLQQYPRLIADLSLRPLHKDTLSVSVSTLPGK